jgi:hypothetical protein
MRMQIFQMIAVRLNDRVAWSSLRFYELDIGIVPNMVVQIYLMENTVMFLYDRSNVVHAASWGWLWISFPWLSCLAKPSAIEVRVLAGAAFGSGRAQTQGNERT